METQLTILVGPSGAGKSTYRAFLPSDVVIVSSDDIRAEINGDFRIQANGDKVWETFYRRAKTALEEGKDVCLDATHLWYQNRKSAYDLVSEDTPITLVVIDRPLEDKLVTAGWRQDVRVKGMSLIERHHEDFLRNKENILKGDDRPNVKVVNLIQYD